MRGLLTVVMLAGGAPLVLPQEAPASSVSAPGVSTEPQAVIPLPEHPRPNFERADWRNLNGEWRFHFDAVAVGERERWFESDLDPFPLRRLEPTP
jgi:hypothetical protein